MRKKILFLMGIFSLGLLQAQVGINTKIPHASSAFHIDGKGDNTSATPSVAQAANDVVITNVGRVGVGTVLPTTKLHVVGNYSGGQPAFRYVDGGQGEGKVLQSDKDGFAHWANPPRTDGKVIYVLAEPFTRPTSVEFSSVKLFKEIYVKDAGEYMLIVRWTGKTRGVRTSPVTYQTAGTFTLTKSSTSGSNWTAEQSSILDKYDHHLTNLVAVNTSTGSVPTQNSMSFSFTLSGVAERNSYLKVYLNVHIGGPWVMTNDGGTENYFVNPSIILYSI